MCQGGIVQSTYVKHADSYQASVIILERNSGSEEACAEPAQLWRGGGRQGGDPQPGHHHP